MNSVGLDSNESKTQVAMIGERHDKICMQMGVERIVTVDGHSIRSSTNIKYLGLIFEQNLHFSAQGKRNSTRIIIAFKKDHVPCLWDF